MDSKNNYPLIIKRYILSIIFLIFGYISFSYAQNGTFFMPHAGYALNVTFIETTTIPITRTTYDYLNIHGGIYCGLLQKGESFSLGIDPALNFGISVPESSILNDELVFDYNIHIPIFLLARLGRGANPYNRKPVGFGVGLGVMANAYKLTTSNILNQRASFAHPAMMLEGNFSTGRGHISVKLRLPLTQVISKVKYSNASIQDRDFNFRSLGLTVAYGFEKRRK